MVITRMADREPTFGAAVWSVVGTDERLREGLARVEQRAAEFAKHYCVPSALPDQSMRETLNASTIHHVWTELAIVQMSYGRRLANMYCDSVESIARRRLHLGSLALRAYLELVGALAFFERRLGNLLTGGIRTQEELTELGELIRLALAGGRFRWETYFTGGEGMKALVDDYASATKDADQPTQDIRQKSPSAFVAELEKRASEVWSTRRGTVTTLYALLSDICHPSAGGDLLFSEIQAQPGQIAHRAEPHDEILKDFVRRVALPILWDVSGIAVTSLTRIGQIGDSLHEEHDSGNVLRIRPTDTD